MKSYPMPSKCKCCSCKCEPLGIHLEFGDGLGSISIPFIDGQTHYEDEIEIDGTFSVLYNPDLIYQSTKISYYRLCEGYGYGSGRLAQSTVYYLFMGFYVRAQERLKFEYNFDIDPDKCKVTTGQFKVASTVDKYQNLVRNNRWVFADYSQKRVIITSGSPEHPGDVFPGCGGIGDQVTREDACDWSETTNDLDYSVGENYPCDVCDLPPRVTNITDFDPDTNPIAFIEYCFLPFGLLAVDEEVFVGTVLLGHATVSWSNKKYCNETEDDDDFFVVNILADGWYTADQTYLCDDAGCFVCCTGDYYSAPGLNRGGETLKVKYYYAV